MIGVAGIESLVEIIVRGDHFAASIVAETIQGTGAERRAGLQALGATAEGIIAIIVRGQGVAVLRLIMDAADHITIGHIGVDHTVLGSGDFFKQITLAVVLVVKAFTAAGDAL